MLDWYSAVWFRPDLLQYFLFCANSWENSPILGYGRFIPSSVNANWVFKNSLAWLNNHFLKCSVTLPAFSSIFNASDTDLAACHRLSKRADSGIIVRFKDLKQRNAWLSGAKNLKKHPDKISVSQDLPPVLRTLKTELLGKRKDLPPPQKSKSNLRYLKSWPYIELKTGTGNIIRPSATRESIAAAVIGFNPLLPVPEPNT